MALLFIDGFDYLMGSSVVAKGWVQLGSGPATANSTGRFGTGKYIHLAYTGTGSRSNVLRYTLPSSHQTIVIGGAFNLIGGTSSAYFVQFISGSNAGSAATVAALTINVTTQKVELRNGAGTVLATGTRNIAVQGWHYIELKVFVNGASSTAEVRVDGIVDISGTYNLGSVNIDAFQLQANNSTNALGGFSQVIVDDLYVLNTSGSAPCNDFLGDVRIETIFPTAEGNSSSFTPLSGTDNALMVDDGTAGYDSDTTYVASSTVGHKDTYICSDIAVITGTVYGVAVNLVARKDDALTRQLKTVVRQGGTDYDGSTTFTISSSYLNYFELMELDPTGAAWTIANVNANEYGMKVVT